MAVSRVSLSSITQGFPKSRSFLDGNSAYNPSSYESIATVTVGAGGSSTITFSSIPSTYKHLQLRWLARDTAAYNSFDPSLIRFNSDSGNNYTAHYLTGNGSSANAGATTSTNYSWIGLTNYGNTTANVFSAGVTDILDYSNTNKYKTIRALSGADCNGSGEAFFNSGLWQSTAAISSIVIYANGAANFAQYSSFALYGVKG